MKAPKFNFVPERQINKEQVDTAFQATISKVGVLAFNSSYVKINELEGKFVRLFCDIEKKVIGWKIIDGKTNLDELKDCRQVKVLENGMVTMGIGKLLKSANIEKPTELLHLPIKLYKSSIFDGEMSYIEIK